MEGYFLIPCYWPSLIWVPRALRSPSRPHRADGTAISTPSLCPSRLFPKHQSYEAKVSWLGGQHCSWCSLWPAALVSSGNTTKTQGPTKHYLQVTKHTTSVGSKSKQWSQATTPVRCMGKAGLWSVTQPLGSHRHTTHKLLINSDQCQPWHTDMAQSDKKHWYIRK